MKQTINKMEQCTNKLVHATLQIDVSMNFLERKKPKTSPKYKNITCLMFYSYKILENSNKFIETVD